MTSKGGWIAGGALLLAVLIVGVTSVTAQRPPFPMPRLPVNETGRYQVVKTTDDQILLVDTTTGDLYRANMTDVKTYDQRPKPAAADAGFPGFPKDMAFPPGKEK